MKICWNFTHLQAIQDVAVFASLEPIWRNLALHYLLTKGSTAVNGCRQNESPNNNPQVIHRTPVHELTSFDKAVFVWNKSISKVLL